MLGISSRGGCPSGQSPFNKQLTSARYGSAPPRGNVDSVPVIGGTKTSIDSSDIFLRCIESLMYSAQLACSVVSWQKAKDTLNSDRNSIICVQVLWHICCDMATQDYGKQPIFGDGGWNSERLLRFIVFSFANSLSASQRRSVFESFNRKLNRRGARLGIQDEYFKLLHTVDDLKSYARPKVADSQYMCIVENAVDLLVDVAAGKSQHTQQAKTETVLLMLLEARFLLFTAAEVYSALSKITEMDGGFRKQCAANLKKVQQADIGLYAAISGVMAKSVNARSIDIRLLCSTLSGITHSSKYPCCAAEEIIKNVSLTLGNIENVEKLDATSLSAYAPGHPGQQVNRKMVRFTDDLARCLRNRDVSPMGVGFQNHREIVYGVYEMVVHGSSHRLEAQYCLKEKNGKGTFPMPQRSVLCGILCSGVVAYHTKKFVNDLLKRESYRVPGAHEIAATEEICTMLGECEALDKRDHHSIKRRIYASVAAFRNMAINICLNLALGDVCRVLGETSLAARVNYRVLALYINMFCNLHPNQMINSRAELEEIYDECGNKLPREIDDLLCMLIDLKYFSYKSSYTGKDKDYSEDIKKHPGHNSGSIQTTLARLLIHSTFSTKTEHKDPVGRLEWLDVLKVLLYECAHMVDIYLALANGMRIKGRGSMVKVRNEALKILASTKLSTLKDFFENDKKVCDKISKIVKKVDGLFKKCREEKQHRLSATQYVNAGTMMKACHDSVWDTANNKRLSGVQIDKQLMAYTICRLYTSARRALHIADSYGLMLGSRYVPPLSFILNVYFHCEEIKRNKTMDFVHGKAACDNYKELGVEGMPSEHNAKTKFLNTASDHLCTHLESPAAEKSSNRRHEENRCVVEKVSNRLETVGVENTAASSPPPLTI